MLEIGSFGLLFILGTITICSHALVNTKVQNINNEYMVDRIVNFNEGQTSGISASVVYQGTDQYYEKPASYIVQNINMTVTYDSDYEFTVVLDDATQPRFRLPYEAPYAYTKPGTLSSPLYSVQIKKDPFSFSVVRTSTGETIFDSSQSDFIYSDYYLKFGTKLPSKYLYGLGERRRDFLYDSGLYTIWNKDQYAQIDYGQGNQQTYGCHPMYLMREASGFWHVVYLRNSNGMDFKYDADQQTLRYMLTGSIIELKFFFGYQQPDDVLKLYHNYINGWTLMPFWAHGYHQSKYGVIYLNDLYTVLQNFIENYIPIDVIWSDIDYMYSFTDFTIDQERYNVSDLENLAQQIHWVPIIDAGVSLNTTSDVYNLGMTYDVWIKSANNNTNPLVGVVWPGVVHWPDWLHPNVSKYWTQLLQELYNKAQFSGIWLDMNENSNFCTGEYNNSCFFLADYLPDGVYPDGNTNIPDGDQKDNLPPSPWAWFNSDALPYLPGGVPLEARSLSINALHYGNVLEFHMHNLNGFLESQATYNILKNLTGERPFILSRSTHVGSGQFTAHWSGDNYASWDFLKYSISCIFNFQLFGLPMTGDDICGFAGNTTVELCARWMQLGAFYPFMRNHMAIGTIDHYPYSLGETVLNASLYSLYFRYAVLKYYYGLFVKNNGTGTVFRPVFFDFPDDESLLSLDTQFLIGSEIMVAAVTEEGATEVDVYFPSGPAWYSLISGEIVLDVNSSAQTLSFPAPLNETLPAFMKGGTIVPMQAANFPMNTASLNNRFTLVVALESQGSYSTAHGILLGISNYSNDASLDKCTGTNDCIVQVNVTTTTNSDGSTEVSFLFLPNTPNSYLEEIIVDGATIMGVKSGDQVYTAVCSVTSQQPIAFQQVITVQPDGPLCSKLEGESLLINEFLTVLKN